MEEKEEIVEIDKKERITKKIKMIFKEIAEWIICFVIAYVLYLLLNYYIGTISGVKQVSMLPTAEDGERLLIQRPTIFEKELKYGDIITFEAPIEKEPKTENIIAEYNEYKGFDSFIYHFIGIGKMTYIKRVIGLPGDHIVISDDGKVYRNGEELKEKYIKDGATPQIGIYSDIVVPEKTVFVMGDNRFESKDSRYFGCIPIEKVNGYVLCRLWPLNKIGKL